MNNNYNNFNNMDDLFNQLMDAWVATTANTVAT